MSKKILLAVLSITVVLGLVGVGTYALFSDTASSTGNQFIAGTMNLLVDGAEDATPMTYGNVYPGWTAPKTYVVTNDGSVRGALSLDVTNLVEAAGAYPSGEAAVQGPDIADLAANLDITIDVNGAVVFTGSLADLDAAALAGIVTLNGGESASVTISASVDASVGNEIMGDSATFDAVFSLQSVPL